MMMMMNDYLKSYNYLYYIEILETIQLCTNDLYLFGLLRLYGISNIIGYSMPNPVYIYIYIYIPTPPLGQDMTQGHF